jgi:hypothetical protein
VPDVDVIFSSNIPEFPKTVTTTATGQYQLDLDAGINYEVRAIKEGDYLNGVTTLDLVLIQRHILGLSIFDEPYKLIASDANNDGRITASDLTEIRKVILGIAPSFKNASWRFPIKYQSLDTQLPFPYKEVYYFTDLQEDKLNQDFTAVKIGDVNASVTINSNSPNTEVRSNNNLILLAEEVEMEAGESVEIPITAINCKEMAGFQLTMNLKGASLIAINNGAIDIRNNIGILHNGTVTMSYAASENVTLTEDEILFTLVVKSTKKALLSELISLGSGITKAESYTGDLHVAGVSLNIRNKSLSKIELFQNEPNPFKGQTTINFFMPQATSATLSVYDLSGKLLEIRKIDAVKGMNSQVFTKESVGSSGVLYYTLESGDFLATKKMIIVE